MTCPKCKYEYEENIKICPDCNVDLVKEKPKKESEYHTVKLLITASSMMEANIIASKLRAFDIPCFLKQKSFGSLSLIVLGETCYGTEIYVNEKMYDSAMDVLALPPIDDDMKEEEE